MLDRKRKISATYCEGIINPPTVTSRTVMAKKQTFRRFERDAKDGVLYESECLNIVQKAFHEI